jgi:hypothetical protein
MRYSNQGRFRQQVKFLRHQFLQDRDLPFGNVLSGGEGIVAQALKAVNVCWLDRIYFSAGHAVGLFWVSSPSGRGLSPST